MMPAGKHFEAVKAAADEIDLLLEERGRSRERDADARSRLDSCSASGARAPGCWQRPDEAPQPTSSPQYIGDVGAAQQRIDVRNPSNAQRRPTR
jgi:hypothetical protein